MSNLSTPTLSEDWIARRAAAARESENEQDRHFNLVRVLDFLLNRYADSPPGQRPARFPNPGSLVLHSRALVVHHHLLAHLQPGRSNSGSAEDRARRFASRMASLNPLVDLGAPAQGRAITRMSDEPYRKMLSRWGRGLVDDLHFMAEEIVEPKESSKTRFLLTHFDRMDPADQEGLLQRIFKILCRQREKIQKPSIMGGLGGQSDIDPLLFYRQCLHPDVLNYVHLAWRFALSDSDHQSYIDQLESIMKQNHPSAAADKFRGELACGEWAVREKALLLLRDLGSLDDVGLLLDLLALPRQSDEAHGERELMRETLVALSRKDYL